ncbi:Uncharacterized protein OBRU01_16096 [Operophtera brumata]|uniref:FP protein C-terminal domain-containing protein n=1 Tax=Operophtera brumata TaxID=104452 RepID=A0A0L7L3I5_OPEBR|nr:Uncharacterized protein OBRU01_16096 [Operophtera brumata]
MEPHKKTTWKWKPCYAREKNSISNPNTPGRSNAELSASSQYLDPISPLGDVLTRTASSLSDSVNVTTSDKPRAVTVKLRSPLQRDGVLAAVFKHNKENKEEKLNTHHLGIGGTRKPVFVSEHLTPANKSLHAAARKRAKDMSYKFVWTRNGRVYLKKNLYELSTENTKILLMVMNMTY